MIRRMCELAGLRPRRLLVPVALGTISVVAGAALVGIAGYLICRAAQQPPILSLTVAMVAVRALAFLRPGARYGERLAAHDLAFRCLGRLRTRVFSALEPLAPAGVESYRDGELLSRVVADVDSMQDLAVRVAVPAGTAAGAGLVLVAGVGAVFVPVGLVLGVGLVCAAVGPPLLAARVVTRTARRQAGLRAGLTSDLVEILDAAEEIWLNEADGRALARVEADDAALVDAALRDARGAGLADACGVAIAGITTVVALGVTSAAAAAGRLDALAVAPLTLVTLAAFEAVLPLAAAARAMPGLVTAAHRVLDLVDTRTGVVDPARPLDMPTAPEHRRAPQIRVRQPRVERRAGVRLLDEVSFDLEPHARVVIAGPSGSGKTTLAHVLVRFLERDGGEVRLDGHDVRAHRAEDVRRTVLLSAQVPHVFDSTVRENVVLAHPGASDSDILAALAHAQLGDWVEALPDGLDTRVGEGGRTLSGGERQRLALARSLLADSPVFIFDEPTAHLDATAAHALLDDLWGATEGRSVLLITHGDPGPFGGCVRVVTG
ncbi:MAG: thiol reductant ABC exporter subunit CydC [Acidimicrobiia bacterium]|nr:thiol reductant ABC exporter subunit CydC [Acidimicrobiia bacterium]